MVSYVAMLDVPKELIHHLARLLAAHRKTRGTRRGRRVLTCHRQALLILVWLRKNEDKTLLAAGFGISRATTYRYIAEGITVLAAQAPELHQALHRASTDGWAFVILDGKLFRTDRCAQLTTNRDGKPVHAWYSGKHRAFGGNIQAVIRPDGLPLWTSPVAEGRTHDSTMAAGLDIYAALYRAADQLGLPALADSGYHGAGPGIHTPVKLPVGSTQLTPDQQAYNQLQRGLRAPGERGFALLTGRWKALRRITASPSRIGTIVQAALTLTHIEHRYTPHPC